MADVKIIDDVYTTIRSDIGKIQQKSTMYISWTGSKGTEQCAREMTNNMIDEDKNENSVSDGHMYITHDAEEGMTYFEDHGRGIPFEELENACTILQAGSKMNREHGDTAGENGVGLTATNALSERFEITSTRNGQSRHLQFREGEKVVDRTIDIKDKTKHGLMVAFKPSKYFLGANNSLPIESFDQWLTKTSFFLDPKVTIHFKCVGLKGKEASFEKEYKNTNGIVGYLHHYESNSTLLPKPVMLTNTTSIIEDNIPMRMEDGSIEYASMERFISVEVAFNYDPNNQVATFHAFSNNIENTEGGEHQNAVKSAVGAFFQKLASENQKKKTKVDIKQDDVLVGISLVLNMKTDMSTNYEGQTKLKLGNSAFYKPVRKLCMDALADFFNAPENKRVLTKILEYIQFNASLRTDMTKKRSQVKTGAPSYMESKCIDNYIPANHVNKKNKDEELELYIYEGDSAGDLGRNARTNADIQGILCIMGKPTNVWDIPSSKLETTTKDKFFPELFNRILRCGYGKNFNAENLVYRKIIFNPDADIDGDHICGLLLCGIFRHAPQLIFQGLVYRCVIPLYKLRGPAVEKLSDVDKQYYLYHKSELFAKFEENLSKRIKLKFEVNEDFVSSANMRRFLETNRDYFRALDELSKFYLLHPDIVEFMASHPNDFKTRMHELGPEMKYDKEGDCVTGIYDKEVYTIIPDKVFMDKLKYLTNVINVGNDGVYEYYIYEKRNMTSEPVLIGKRTIGQIMTVCQKYYPEISDRYKGAGELSEIEMYMLAMNPLHRLLIRFNVSDVENTTSTFNDLFLDNAKSRAIRKQMVVNSDISIDDIDN